MSSSMTACPPGSRRPTTRCRCIRVGPHAQRGASVLIFLVSLAITLGGLLAAVDLARIQLAQDRLQSALDSAVQSAARRFGTAANAAWEPEIRAWMQANHDAPFTLSVQPGRERLSATARTSLRLLSTGFLPFSPATRTLNAASGTPLSNLRRLEVVVALDVSSSPESWLGLLDPRAWVSRQAAWDLIRGLLPETPDPNIRVGLVPFADTVKIAEPGRVSSAAVRAWMDSYWNGWLDTWIPASVNSRNPWTGCVSERGLSAGGTATPLQRDLIAGPGTPGNLAPLFLPHGFQLTPLSNRPDWRLTPNSIPTARPGYAVAAGIASARQLSTWVSLPAPNCGQVPAMTYLSANRSAFEATFARLLALPTTGNDTSLLPLGPLWAWRMLTPSWRTGVWADPAAPSPQTERVIVLVTSGLNRPQRTAQAYSGPSFGVPYAVDFSYQPCFWILTCLTYESARTERFTSDGATGGAVVQANSSISANANTLTSLNAHGTALYPGAEQSQPTHLDQYTRSLCRQLAGTDIKLYTLLVQPRYLREVALPCAVPEQRETQLISWSSPERLSTEVGDLANRILEAYRNPP